MRRRAFMLVLLLALGVCTSVLVAWAGALVDRDGWPDTLLTRSPTGARTEMRGWLVEQGRDRTLTWRTFDALDLWDGPPDLESPTELPAWSVGRDLPDQPGPFVAARERTRDVAWEVSAGWPARCVRATRGAGPAEFALPGEFVRGGVAAMAVEWPISHDAIAEADRPGVDAWPAGGLAAVVPVRPMLGGLVVNTIVFALAWGVVLSPLVSLRVLRRWRRRKKNRCVRCGHSVQGLPDGAPCPECGRNLRERTTIAELLTARAPMLGASLALVLVVAASAVLVVHRWMAVDRLPPLHHAAAVGDVQQIERLLAGGAVVDEPVGDLNTLPTWMNEDTALRWAAARGHLGAAERLLDAGAHPHAGGFRSDPFAMAVGRGHDDVARVLLPRLTPDRVPTAMTAHLALANDAWRRLVLERFRWQQAHLADAARLAIAAHDASLLDDVVRAGLLPGGSRSGNLVASGVEADARANAAPYHRPIEWTRRLLELGFVDTPEARFHAVGAAVATGCVPALDAILADDPTWESTGLRYAAGNAAEAGHVAMIRRLAALGVDMDGSASGLPTPLFRAALAIRPDAVAALLDAGVDPRVRPAESPYSTPLGMLTHLRDEAERQRRADPNSPYLRRADDVQRILDLLEAAEARWDARGESPQDPAAPDGG